MLIPATPWTRRRRHSRRYEVSARIATVKAAMRNGAGNMANQDDRAEVKKPYDKPAFRFERVFETMALSCGKVSPTQGGCVHNRQAS